MEERLLVTASPHIRDHSTTRGLMGAVVAALMPCVLASALIFGARALLLVAVTALACVPIVLLFFRQLNAQIAAMPREGVASPQGEPAPQPQKAD